MLAYGCPRVILKMDKIGNGLVEPPAVFDIPEVSVCVLFFSPQEINISSIANLPKPLRNLPLRDSILPQEKAQASKDDESRPCLPSSILTSSSSSSPAEDEGLVDLKVYVSSVFRPLDEQKVRVMIAADSEQ